MTEIAVPNRAGAAQKKYRLENQFRNIHILFFLLMACVMVLVVTLIIRNITRSVSRDYARFYSIEAVNKFNSYLSQELGLVAQVARSGALVNWFTDEANRTRKAAAYQEMMNYAEKLHSAEFYFGINASLNEYSVRKDARLTDFKPFDVLSPTKEYDHWYFTCINSQHAYTLNIDIDKVTNQKRLWINHKVSRNGAALGVFCSGLQFGQVIEELFGKYDSASVRGFVVNAKGIIQMDSTLTGSDGLSTYEVSRRIQEISGDHSFTAAMNAHFQGSGEYFSAQDMPQVIKIETGPYSFVSLAPIADTNWTVVTLFNSESLFSAAKLLPLLYAVFIVLIVYVIAITVLNKKLIFVPFSRLIASLNKADTDKNEKIFGSDLNNEFSEIAQTIQNMRERLSTAVQTAERANKAKTEFLSSMSHEIRTPMNAILGIIEIQLQNDTIPQDIADALQRIHSSGDLLLNIINDILDLSKIEAGKLEILPTRYEILSLINDTVTLNLMRVGGKLITFELSVDENTPSDLFGDELRIKQILNNLLSNAFKYTKKGMVKLSISAETANEQNASEVTLVFTVSDTGQGMTEAQLDRLFDEYLRFNMDANRTIEGTGLGMGITRNLIGLMNGELFVKSAPQKGSVFTVRLPQKSMGAGILGKEMAENLQNFQLMSINQVKRAQILIDPMPYGSVLIVDDVESNLYVAKGLLSPYRLSVDTAVSGFEAIKKIKAGNEYDIVFMDHMMPQMDGIEAMQELRALGYAGVVVVLTANALAGNDAMFMQKGFDGFLSKPIDMRQLNAVLNKFIRNRYPEKANTYTPETMTQAETSEIAPKLLQIFCHDAEKAAVTLRAAVASGDIKLFTTAVHAMKSALANIGESEASQTAFALENAGLKGDADFVAANADGFIERLEALVKNLSSEESADTDDADAMEDAAYLAEQLQIVKAACEDYDDAAAYAALDRLQEKPWKPATVAALDEIRNALFLHSDFDWAAKRGKDLLGGLHPLPDR